MATILSKLTLTDETKKAVAVDKTKLRREKVVANLLEQADIAKAMIEGNEYVAMRLVEDENGNSVETQKRIKKWFLTTAALSGFYKYATLTKQLN